VTIERVPAGNSELAGATLGGLLGISSAALRLLSLDRNVVGRDGIEGIHAIEILVRLLGLAVDPQTASELDQVLAQRNRSRVLQLVVVLAIHICARAVAAAGEGAQHNDGRIRALGREAAGATGKCETGLINDGGAEHLAVGYLQVVAGPACVVGLGK